jgi:hypothetical protein
VLFISSSYLSFSHTARNPLEKATLKGSPTVPITALNSWGKEVPRVCILCRTVWANPACEAVKNAYCPSPTPVVNMLVEWLRLV